MRFVIELSNGEHKLRAFPSLCVDEKPFRRNWNQSLQWPERFQIQNVPTKPFQLYFAHTHDTKPTVVSSQRASPIPNKVTCPVECNIADTWVYEASAS